MGDRARFEHLLATGEDLLESGRAQRMQFVGEAWQVRNPRELDKKIADFLDVQGLPSAEVRRAYDEQKNLLCELFGDEESGLKKDLLYHGTGLYKYDREKYKKDAIRTEVVPLFGSILDEGLKTHQDQWMPDEDMESASLADSYFYAKWYASKNMTENSAPEWQLGNPNDFFRFFMADTFRAEINSKKIVKTGLEHLKKRRQRVELKKERSQKYENKLREWTKSYRKDTSDNTSIQDLLNGQSDITNNMGIVLCFDREQVPYQKLSVGGAHEVRTTNLVSPKTIKAIGVPLKGMVNIQIMLAEHGRDDIEVFALECADLHFASFEIQDLVARIE